MPSTVPISMLTEARVRSSGKFSFTKRATSGEVVVTDFSAPPSEKRSSASPISPKSAFDSARAP